MMGLVPFWQPSTLCCCSQFSQLYCCIVENKPSLSCVLFNNIWNEDTRKAHIWYWSKSSDILLLEGNW